jgi:membrane protein YqaA with SNARE-associated domain
LPFVRSLTLRLSHLLALHGGWGLFAISFLDATFLAFPLLNDLLLIHLASRSPGLSLIYALESTAGSVLGYSTLYAICRRGGGFLWRRRSPQAMGRASQWLERNDFVAILAGSLLPPPVPFKPFVISAGVLRMNFRRFGLALLVGRSLRFFAGALLGVYYGARAEAYFKQNLGWASLVSALLLVGITLVYRALSSPPRPCQGPPPEVPPA